MLSWRRAFVVLAIINAWVLVKRLWSPSVIAVLPNQILALRPTALRTTALSLKQIKSVGGVAANRECMCPPRRESSQPEAPWIQLSNSIPQLKYEELLWRKHLGTVPFYMYDSAEWNELMNVPVTCRGKSSRFVKRCNGFYFLHHLRFHPWRVRDPEKAALLVIPLIMMDVLGEGICFNHLADVLKKARRLIHAAGLQSRQHFLYMPHFVSSAAAFEMKWSPVRDWILGVQELNPWTDIAPKGYRFVSSPLSTMAVDHLYPALKKETPKSYRSRKFTFSFIGQADNRKAYATRRKFLKALGKINTPNALVRVECNDCKGLPECPPDFSEMNGCSTAQRIPFETQIDLVANSKCSVIARGDHGGSQRISQSAGLGTLMAVFGTAAFNEGLPFHCQIPWKRIVYTFPDETVFDLDQGGQIVWRRLSSESDAELATRIDLFHKHVPDVVWEVDNSRVAENILLNAAELTSAANLKNAGVSHADFECEVGSMHFTPKSIERL